VNPIVLGQESSVPSYELCFPVYEQVVRNHERLPFWQVLTLLHNALAQ
jgi:hypothetical protein